MRRPRFIAEQARHARGPLGRLIAFIMARETWRENQRAIDALEVRETDHVIDIGCGHGRSLGALAARAASGRVVGVDPSDLMTEIAMTRNKALVKAGRVKVKVASAADLPFADDTFDRALCVHVIYFWRDLRTSFREIARVLKPGGSLVLAFRTDADQAVVRAFPADVYCFRAIAEVTGALRSAGFSIDEGADQSHEQGGKPIFLAAMKRDAATSQAKRSAKDQNDPH
jgi:ubiquinone/menaquinone biosynthesis C-methylase UbiE